MNEGVSCGAVSVGEYNRVIYYYQESWQRKLATLKSLKADVSSVSPFSERLEELWVACVFLCWNGATLLVEIWWRENKRVKSARWYRGDKEYWFERKIFALEFFGFPNNLDIGKGHKLPYAAKNN